MRSREVPISEQSARADSPSAPSDHYAASKAARQTINLATWLDDHGEDPAVKVRSCIDLAMLSFTDP